MNTFFFTIITSLVISLVIILLAKRKNYFLSHQDTVGIQKMHLAPTPHVGGLAIFISFSLGLWLFDSPDSPSLLKILWFASLPTFIIGIIEDFTAKVSPTLRLIFIFISITILAVLTDIKIDQLGFHWIDNFITQSLPILSLIITLLIVGGTVNSFNIIDGFNGLMAGFALLILAAIIFVAYLLNDLLIIHLSLLLVAAIAGFFVFNFPLGRIFCGDGGAYFIGFMLANTALLLTSRHPQLSSLFFLSLFTYPLFETLFSIYRRKIIKNKFATQADSLHLHTLIYKRLIRSDFYKKNSYTKAIRNSSTAPFLWLLSLTSIIPTIIWYDNDIMLLLCPLLLITLYVMVYRRIVRFKLKLF